ncbi:sterile alpha motif domain-containing protein 1-like [Homo sapiens]|uniref:sterile alpha motif domain-containing protein 1-like n=1 Tax=Homo sapiens TaxID=9606 RepID=UPI0005D033D2|nr:sterile alpha motif domain-containing protein 1-like [Homo sapiens]|eukprot:XP_011528963.1 atherin-like [Homo sapiens]
MRESIVHGKPLPLPTEAARRPFHPPTPRNHPSNAPAASRAGVGAGEPGVLPACRGLGSVWPNERAGSDEPVMPPLSISSRPGPRRQSERPVAADPGRASLLPVVSLYSGSAGCVVKPSGPSAWVGRVTWMRDNVVRSPSWRRVTSRCPGPNPPLHPRETISSAAAPTWTLWSPPHLPPQWGAQHSCYPERQTGGTGWQRGARSEIPDGRDHGAPPHHHCRQGTGRCTPLLPRGPGTQPPSFEALALRTLPQRGLCLPSDQWSPGSGSPSCFHM